MVIVDGERSVHPPALLRSRRSPVLNFDWTEYIMPALAMLASGLLAGFMAGLFGIGGGFVVVPAISMILSSFSGGSGANDHTMHVAIGTSLGTIVLTSLRSVQAHARR